MSIELRIGGDLHLSSSERTLLEDRIHLALSRFRLRLGRVTVHVSDENGPRGGVDKHVVLVVALREGEPVVVEDRGEQLRPLILRATARASQALERAAGRARASRRAALGAR